MRTILSLYCVFALKSIVAAQRLLPAAIQDPSMHIPQNINIQAIANYGTSLLIGGDFNSIQSAEGPDLCLFDGFVYSSFEPALNDGLGNNTIYSILTSNDDLIVAGVLPAYNGLARLIEGTWEAFGPSASDTVLTIFSYQDGFVCLTAQNLFHYNQGAWVTVTNPTDQFITDIIVRDDMLYAISDQQLYSYVADNWNLLSIPNFQAMELSMANDVLFCAGMDISILDAPLVKYYSINADQYIPFAFNYISPKYIGSVYYLDEKYVISTWRDHEILDVNNSACQIDNNCVYQQYTYAITAVASLQDHLHLAIQEFISPGHYTYHRAEGCNYLENDVQVTYQTANAASFYNPNYQAGHAIKTEANALVGTIFNSSIWLSAIVDNDTIASVEHFGDINDRSFGPASNALDLDYYYKYQRVFRINRVMIENHLANFGDPNYTMPIDIRDWPAHGDVSNGEAQDLAPFMDLDNNGIYNPELGDYPAIKGDQCAYYILNDVRRIYRPPFYDPYTDSLAIEEHVMQYVFEDGDIALQNALFMEHRIINRSTRVFDEMSCGIWTDFDIGNAADDFVGTDSLRQCVYVYNGDANDQPSSQSLGFGSLPYSSGCVLLNVELDNSMYHNIGTNPVTGEPYTYAQHYNLLNARWKNGDNLLYGGNGYTGQGVTELPAHFYFPSHPASVESTDWNEQVAGNSPGDRRILANFKINDFQPNDTYCIHYAFVDARADIVSNQANIESVDRMLERVDSVVAFYDNNLSACMEDAIAFTEETNLINTNAISVFPNPGSSQLQITLPAGDQNGVLSIYDTNGKVVLKETQHNAISKRIIDVEQLAQGLYLIEWISPTAKTRCKWMKANNY